MDRPRAFQVLAVATAVGTYATIVLGGYVSATGAGLVCPDWPTCQGAVVPDLSNPWILAEYVHRLSALITGGLIAATAAGAILWFRREGRIVSLSLAAGSLLAGQVTLGMLTIASGLDPVVVTGHLAIAGATLAATTALAVVALAGFPPRSRAPLPAA